jgi:hypothetical protein
MKSITRIKAAVSNNPTLRERPIMRYAKVQGCNLLWHAISGNLPHTQQSKTPIHNPQLAFKKKEIQAELDPLRSQLLGVSRLVSFPLLNNMLKFCRLNVLDLRPDKWLPLTDHLKI